MTPKQITDALQSLATVLELIAGDREFQDLIDDPRSHPEIASDLADARHYVAELIDKLADVPQQKSSTQLTTLPKVIEKL